MILGLVLFFAAHTFTTKRKARAKAIARLGERTYKILYSLVSLAGLVLIVRGFGHYREAGIWNVWEPPTFLKYITLVLMLPAFILFVASYIRGHIFATVKHPMLASTKLWAARASACEWRSWLHHPVRVVPGLGWLRPHFAKASH